MSKRHMYLIAGFILAALAGCASKNGAEQAAAPTDQPAAEAPPQPAQPEANAAPAADAQAQQAAAPAQPEAKK